MKTGLSKKQKITNISFDEDSSLIDAYAGHLVHPFRISWCNDSGFVVHSFR